MSDKKEKKKAGSNLNFLFIIGLILSILMIVFAIQNGDPTEIDFFVWKVTPPLALLIVLCIAIGALLALMFSIPGWRRRRKAKRQLLNEIKTLRKNYEELAAVNQPKA